MDSSYILHSYIDRSYRIATQVVVDLHVHPPSPEPLLERERDASTNLHHVAREGEREYL